MAYQITTQRELRDSFWEAHPKLFRGWKPGNATRASRSMTQNEYPTDTRVAWCDYVESCTRNGTISEALAQRATL